MPSIDTSKTEWDLSSLLQGDDDPAALTERQAIRSAAQAFIGRWKGRRDYLEQPAVLAEALAEYERLQAHYGTEGREGYYFHLRAAQDQGDPAVKAHEGQIDEFGRGLEAELSFFELAISKIKPGRRQVFLQAEELSPYRYYLERLFAWAPYLLSEREEKILSLKAPTAFANWVRLTSGFLAREEREVVRESGETVRLSFSAVLGLISSPQKPVRDRAAEAFNDILRSQADLAEAELNSVLADKKINDSLRGLSYPEQARHLQDGIDTAAVEAMVTAVRAAYPLAHRYYALKARLLGVPRLAYHERNVEYGQLAQQYSYAEAVELVHSVFAGLDPEFAAIMKRLVEGGNLDVFPRGGKRGGAFCAHGLIGQPVYILLNHTDTLSDVRTLAHELGHAINDELMRLSQNSLNFGSSLATAEVASTFMEDFVLERIGRDLGDRQRLAVLMTRLNDSISSIFRQVAIYSFEQELHRQFRAKGYLSRQEIGRLFQGQMMAYMGEAVEQSPGSENWWVYIGHLRQYFYVYSYASGLLISHSLQAKVRQDPAFIAKVKEFLSLGLSCSPRQAFLGLGLDINQAQVWEEGLAGIERLLEEAERLAKQEGTC